MKAVQKDTFNQQKGKLKYVVETSRHIITSIIYEIIIEKQTELMFHCNRPFVVSFARCHDKFNVTKSMLPKLNLNENLPFEISISWGMQLLICYKKLITVGIFLKFKFLLAAAYHPVITISRQYFSHIISHPRF